MSPIIRARTLRRQQHNFYVIMQWDLNRIVTVATEKWVSWQQVKVLTLHQQHYRKLDYL